MSYKSKNSISAVYIVKNEEEYLPFSIKSIYNAVDKIIVLDNGSTDQTPMLAKGFDKVKLLYDGRENFSYLRNKAMKEVDTEWFLWIDADEVYYQDIEEKLPFLLLNNEVDCYYNWFYHLMCSYYFMQNINDKDERYKRISIIRNSPKIRFEGAVHERLIGCGSHIADSELFFVHYGYTKPPEVILEHWKQYDRLGGTNTVDYNIDPQSLLVDRPLYPFRKEHPEVIREYVHKKAEILAGQGDKLYQKLPPVVEAEGIKL